MDGVRDLERLGYSPRWKALFAAYAEAGLRPARVVRSDRGVSVVATAEGSRQARPSTRLLKEGPAAALPVVGDWVALRDDPAADVAHVEAVLERTSSITRGDPGKTSQMQVLAANVDVVFVAHPIAEEPNLRRIERELSIAWESGAVPVVVLTKSDLSRDPEAARDAVESIAFGVDVLLTMGLSAQSAAALLPYLSPDRTGVLLGPSGAGKSTLINALLGEQRQRTAEVREADGRGRHTTVTRELVPLPDGGVLIDTPGLRALGMTGSEEGIASAFPEIDRLAEGCRFRDCGHGDEPGCAVRAAVESGELPAERLESYHKLLREARFEACKSDARLRAEEERVWKTRHKELRDWYKRTGRG